MTDVVLTGPYKEKIREFIQRDLISDPNVVLADETPLLEWGLVTSLNIAKLLLFVREEFSVRVGPEHVVGRNFCTLDAVTALVHRIKDQTS
jgi:acyl carrier protein